MAAEPWSVESAGCMHVAWKWRIQDRRNRGDGSAIEE
jgi:hypothetical protein